MAKGRRMTQKRKSQKKSMRRGTRKQQKGGNECHQHSDCNAVCSPYETARCISGKYGRKCACFN